MGKIAILSDVLASQVAAGEVVERPSSVVKELIENSLDAGASHIEVEIHKGGVTLIKVTDNGCGMSREDALMSLERHATSKLKTLDGLNEVNTMGFRGEAVPSIASISKMKLSTQEKEALEGTEIIIEGGVIKEVKAVGMQAGTSIEIKNLFFNVPARRKFLRTEATEAGHVEHQVKLHALAYPHVRFCYKRDNRMVFDLPASKDRRVRILGLNDAEIARKLIEIPLTDWNTPSAQSASKESPIQVSGYILPAEYARKGKRQQYVFLNNRPIEDLSVSRAIKDGFKATLPNGFNPTCWLYITIDPSLVDVNVHPAKREVRFNRPHEIRGLIMQAIEEAFIAHLRKQQMKTTFRGEAKIVSRKTGVELPLDSSQIQVEKEPSQRAPQVDRVSPQEIASPASQAFTSSKNILPQKPQQLDIPAPTSNTEGEALVNQEPQFKILAPLGKQYILMEGEEGLVILKPNAARERIVYEEVIKSIEAGETKTQGLLVPEVIHLDARDFAVVIDNKENFINAGIQLEDFGGNSIQIRSIPELLHLENPKPFILALIDELIETQGGKKGKKLAFESFAQQMAAKAARATAFKFSQTAGLLEALFKCDLPYCTPSGSATIIQTSYSELERKFK